MYVWYYSSVWFLLSSSTYQIILVNSVMWNKQTFAETLQGVCGLNNWEGRRFNLTFTIIICLEEESLSLIWSLSVLLLVEDLTGLFNFDHDQSTLMVRDQRWGTLMFTFKAFQQQMTGSPWINVEPIGLHIHMAIMMPTTFIPLKPWHVHTG